MPTWSVTVRPWKFTLPIGKDRLPNHHGFQGQTVKLVGCNYSIKQKYTTKNIPSSTCWIHWRQFLVVKKHHGSSQGPRKNPPNTSVIRWWVGFNSQASLREWNGSTTSCSGKPDDFIWAGQRTEGWANGWLVGWLVWENWSNLMGCLFYALVVVMEWSWFDEIEIWGAYSSWEIFKNDKLFSWSELV